MSRYETNIDNIFGPNGAKGECPEVEEPETPEDEADRIAFKIWEIAYSDKVKFDQKLAVEKTPYLELNWGRCQTHPRTLSGKQKSEETHMKHMMLLRGALQTHMSNSRLGAAQSLHKTQNLHHIQSD